MKTPAQCLQPGCQIIRKCQWLLLLWLFTCRGIVAAQTDTQTVRLAWFEFADETDGASGFVADLGALAQSEFTPPAGVVTVERSALQRAGEELRLAAGLGASRSAAVRAGRWLRADFGLRGSVFRDEEGAVLLELELIDLGRAEIRHAAKHTLAKPETTPVVTTDQAIWIAAQATQWLQAERARPNANPAEVSVAILPVGPAPAALAENLERITRGQPVRLLRLNRSSVSLDEAELALAGMTAPSEDWRGIADYYVWQEADSPPSACWIWDGRHAPRRLDRLDTSSPWWLERPLGHPQPEIRRTLARRLTQAGWELGTRDGGPHLAEQSGLAKWLQAVWTLETARFFDPASAEASEAWLRLRFGELVKDRSRRRQAFCLQRALEWQRHVSNFGYGANLAASGSILPLFISAQTEAAWCHGPSRSSSHRAAPESWRWRGDLAGQIARAWLATPQDPTQAAIRHQLWDHLLPPPDEPEPLAFAKERFTALSDAWLRFPPLEHQRDFLRKGRANELHRLARAAGTPQAAAALLDRLRASSDQPAQRNASDPTAEEDELLPTSIPTPVHPILNRAPAP